MMHCHFVFAVKRKATGEIEKFKATAEERETRREQQSAARIQAAARGKAGRQRVATMKEGEVAPAQPPELEPSAEPEPVPQPEQ